MSVLLALAPVLLVPSDEERLLRLFLELDPAAVVPKDIVFAGTFPSSSPLPQLVLFAYSSINPSVLIISTFILLLFLIFYLLENLVYLFFLSTFECVCEKCKLLMAILSSQIKKSGL